MMIFKLLSRTLLFGLGFFACAGFFSLIGIEAPMDAARAWWPIYGILVNLVSFFLLRLWLKAEGRKAMELVGWRKPGIRKDLLTGFLLTLASMVVAFLATMFPGYLIFGNALPGHLMSFTALPLWAKIVSLSAFPLVNSITEELTYNGYLFPRMEGMVTSRAAAVLSVLFFFTLQHVFIPFAPNLLFLAWRFVAFVPLLLLWILVYAKMRRLTSLILVHFVLDIFGISSTMFM